MINIPNSLTILRIIGASFIPFILLIDTKEWGCFIVLIIFFLCSVTDFLDGFIARKLNQRSKLGKMLDPIADKLLIILVLCFLTIVFKDKYGIREFFGTKNNIFDVLTLSKYKTACQMLAIILLLTSTQNFIWNVKFYYIGIVFLWISAFIALYTGLVYFIKSLKILED